jgi:hypothetical protein
MEGEREVILSAAYYPFHWAQKQTHFVFEDTTIDNIRHSILMMGRNTDYIISMTGSVIWHDDM